MCQIDKIRISYFLIMRRSFLISGHKENAKKNIATLDTLPQNLLIRHRENCHLRQVRPKPRETLGGGCRTTHQRC